MHVWLYYQVLEPDGIPRIGIRRCMLCGEIECSWGIRVFEWEPVPENWDWRMETWINKWKMRIPKFLLKRHKRRVYSGEAEKYLFNK